MDGELQEFDVTYLILPVEDAAKIFPEFDEVTKALIKKAVFLKSQEKYVVLAWDSRKGDNGWLDDNQSNILLEAIRDSSSDRYLMISEGRACGEGFCSIVSGMGAQETIRDMGLTVDYKIPAEKYVPAENNN